MKSWSRRQRILFFSGIACLTGAAAGYLAGHLAMPQYAASALIQIATIPDLNTTNGSPREAVPLVSAFDARVLLDFEKQSSLARDDAYLWDVSNNPGSTLLRIDAKGQSWDAAEALLKDTLAFLQKRYEPQFQLVVSRLRIEIEEREKEQKRSGPLAGAAQLELLKLKTAAEPPYLQKFEIVSLSPRSTRPVTPSPKSYARLGFLIGALVSAFIWAASEVRELPATWQVSPRNHA